MTNGYGNDVSRYGFDELDMSSFYFLESSGGDWNCLDIGSGLSHVSLVYSLMGNDVEMIDLRDRSEIPVLRQYNLWGNYYKGNAFEIIRNDLSNKNYYVVYSQKFIHFLKYDKAKLLLSEINDLMLGSGKLFISTSSLHSELREGYGGLGDCVEERYSFLSSGNQKKHDIKNKVCLYNMNEFRDLLESVGFDVDIIYTSDFGTIKAIAKV